MSTRSHIAIKNADGTVRSIYHHWDGYLEGVGAVLLEHYTTEDRINKLLDLGDMSMIGSEPVGYWSDSISRPDPNACMTYRERGESNVDARIFSSLDDYLDHAVEDYTYIFIDGEWYYREWDDRDLKLVAADIQK